MEGVRRVKKRARRTKTALGKSAIENVSPQVSIFSSNKQFCLSQTYFSIVVAKSSKKDGKKLVKEPNDGDPYEDMDLYPSSTPYNDYPTSSPYHDGDSDMYASYDSEDEVQSPRHVLPPVGVHTRSGGNSLRTAGNISGGRITPNGQAGQQLSVDPDEDTETHGELERHIYSGRFNGPHITRDIYAEPVLLKAHSNSYLEDKDPQIFNVLQGVMTPYLQRALGNELSAYQLEIVYAPEQTQVPDDQPSYVTDVEVSVVLKVTSNSVHELKQTNAETASLWIRDFFKGGELYQFLGECRQSDCDISELVFRGEEFRHPIFSGPAVSEVVKPDEPTSIVSAAPNASEKSRVGIFAALGAGFIVLAAVFAVSFEQRYRSNVLKRLRLEALSDSDSRSRSSTSSSPGFQGRRRRTFSDSFRRHPAGGIKPAAIQKKPAFSADLKASMSTTGLVPPSVGPPSIRSERSNQRFDDHSYSVAGDFNIPSEYSLKASPFPEYHRNSPSRRYGNEEEFGMPEAYSMTSSGFGTPVTKYSQDTYGYSPKQQGDHHGKSKRGSNASKRITKGRGEAKPVGAESPAPSSVTKSPHERDVYINDSPMLKMVDSYLDNSPSLQMVDGPDMIASTPMSNNAHDEWSIDSYSTISVEKKPDPPTRGRSKAKNTKKSPTDNLDIPHLT